MKRTVKILIPCLLAALFFAGGVGLMLHCIGTGSALRQEIAGAEAALAQVDPGEAEETEAALAELLAENEALAMEISGLEAEIAEGAERLAALQADYDAACLEEETAYFLAVRDSLTEGMGIVDDATENAG